MLKAQDQAACSKLKLSQHAQSSNTGSMLNAQIQEACSKFNTRSQQVQRMTLQAYAKTCLLRVTASC